MRTIVHLSDLHFGRLDRRVVAPLVAAIGAIAPDLVAVSGDFTQRARASQFVEARDFLATLPWPRLVVPGNHDVPLFDVARRFLRPLARYRQFIADDVEPVFIDAEIAALGLNSARSLTFGRGRLNADQIRKATEVIIGFARTREVDPNPREMPCGRLAWSFYLTHDDDGAYIDLSVMPKVPKEPVR